MNIDEILKQFKSEELSMDDARSAIKSQLNLGFANLDTQRKSRTGFPEVIYAEGKTNEHLLEIFKALSKTPQVTLATRVSEEKADAVLKEIPDAVYHKAARMLAFIPANVEIQKRKGSLAVICAGTSDIPVAEEAAWTAHYMGCEVKRHFDIGVAGLHRLVDRLEELRKSTAIVVVAGMEGALPSVIGGLVSVPIIAVPTSVGYGANFQGISALLAMLNSCSPGISVVNIDNGFGGGYAGANICFVK